MQPTITTNPLRVDLFTQLYGVRYYSKQKKQDVLEALNNFMYDNLLTPYADNRSYNELVIECTKSIIQDTVNNDHFCPPPQSPTTAGIRIQQLGAPEKVRHTTNLRQTDDTGVCRRLNFEDDCRRYNVIREHLNTLKKDFGIPEDLPKPEFDGHGYVRTQSQQPPNAPKKQFKRFIDYPLIKNNDVRRCLERDFAEDTAETLSGHHQSPNVCRCLNDELDEADF